LESPYLIIVGEAGSGKDTVAGFLEKNHGYQAIAQADPMKRFAKEVFGFTEHQLWGPSEARNAEDPRFNVKIVGNAWGPARKVLEDQRRVVNCLPEVFNLAPEEYFRKLKNWFNTLETYFYELGLTLTPRAMLQTFGTEFGRDWDLDLWSHITIKAAKLLVRGGYTYNRTVGLVRSTHPGYAHVVITDGRFRNEVLNVLEVGGKALKLTNPVDESAGVEKAGLKGHRSEAEQKGIPDDWYTFKLVNDKTLGLDSLEERVKGLATPLLQITWGY